MTLNMQDRMTGDYGQKERYLDNRKKQLLLYEWVSEGM